jgi:hypothetical protein
LQLIFLFIIFGNQPVLSQRVSSKLAAQALCLFPTEILHFFFVPPSSTMFPFAGGKSLSEDSAFFFAFL